MKTSLVTGYTDFIVKRPWQCLFVTMLLIFLAGYGGRYIQFTNDYRVFFSADNPELQAFEAMQDIYTKTDNVLFVITPDDGNSFTKETLSLITDLTEAAWQIPYSTRVDSVTNFQHTTAEEDDLLVRDLVENPDDLTSSDIANIKDVALHEPLLVRRLVSDSGDVMGVNVTIQLPGKSLTEVPEVATASRHIVADMLAAYPHHKIHLTGLAMMNNAFSESSQADMATLVPLMFLAVIVVLGVLLRSMTATVAAVFMIVASIVFAMGMMGWLGWKLTAASASAPTIILTMAVADTVHLLVTFLHNLRHGMPKDAAMKESLRINFQPIFITSITTAIGFLSMNFSDVPPFHDLGNVVAIGVVCAFVLSITLLPSIMMILPVKSTIDDSRENQLMAKFADRVIANRQKLLIGMGILALALIAFLPKNHIDDQFVQYFDESVDFRQATDYASQHLSGIYTLQYALIQGESGGVNDPVFLQGVARFVDWLRTQPEVMHVQSISDTFKRLNKNMHGDDPAYYRLPENRELAAQYLLLYELSLPYGLDLNNQIDVDKAQTRINITVENLHTNEMLALESRISAWLAAELPDIDYIGASPSLMFAHIGQRNVSSMLIGTTLALVLISFILVIALRSTRLGLISLVPNLLPAGMAFGLWGLLVGQVGLSLSVVAGMTLGIVVDDTVHFLSKYLRARREKGLDAQQAVRYAFNTVGIALWVTSLVLILGFWILSQSHFALNADMGMMAAITIAIALMIDFLFLPALLMKLEDNKHA